MRVLIFNICFFSFTFLHALAALISTSFPNGQARMRWHLKQHALFIQWMVRVILRGKIEIRGLEHLEGGAPAIIAPKHQSELDVFIPTAIYPNLAAIAMSELANYPLIGPALRKLDYILVSVSGKKKNHFGQVMEGARRVHAQGRSILIYPEGELMRLGSRERYKSGVFHIYEGLGKPVIPAAQSLGLIWPQREWRKNIGQTGVWEFLEPIPPGLDKETFMRELEDRIETRTIELIREHGDAETVAIAEKRFEQRLNNFDKPVLPRSAKPSMDAPESATDMTGE